MSVSRSDRPAFDRWFPGCFRVAWRAWAEADCTLFGTIILPRCRLVTFLIQASLGRLLHSLVVFLGFAPFVPVVRLLNTSLKQRRKRRNAFESVFRTSHSNLSFVVPARLVGLWVFPPRPFFHVRMALDRAIFRVLFRFPSHVSTACRFATHLPYASHAESDGESHQDFLDDGRRECASFDGRVQFGCGDGVRHGFSLLLRRSRTSFVRVSVPRSHVHVRRSTSAKVRVSHRRRPNASNGCT